MQPGPNFNQDTSQLVFYLFIKLCGGALLVTRLAHLSPRAQLSRVRFNGDNHLHHLRFTLKGHS